MTLSQVFSIATRHQRSTRINSDLSADFFSGLVYHGTAQTALETLFRQYAQTGQSAYTLTGPYGSGKSTIALLLTGLLHADSVIRSAALDVINTESTELLNQSIEYRHGWLQIRSVGGVNGPVEVFWQATLNALEEHPKTKVLAAKYRDHKVLNDSQLIATWSLLFTEAKRYVDGVLILADEMGKSLEFINKNKGELHLFQDIAEIFSRIETPVIFVGLLHQSFSEYAKNRGTKLQEEWGKIQGRYNDILYNVSSDETVALIGKSIISNNVNDNFVDKNVDRLLSALNFSAERKLLLRSRLLQCVPLHPLTALLLGPISKRRFSQNERSTFSFLNSHENNSFQLFLKNTSDINARFNLVNLWNYLETNHEHTILNSPDGHAWAAAAESIRIAVQKDLPEPAINLLKTIALITLFGKPANLAASDDLLLAATDIVSKEDLANYLSQLKEKSCVIYRKHISSWVVFEGSDLDIPTIIDNKIEQLTNSEEAIDHINFSEQVIAKGHYHKTGTLRWVDKKIVAYNVDVEFNQNIGDGAFAMFILLLSDQSSIQINELSKNNKQLIVGNAKNSHEIHNLARECYAIELIKADKEIGTILQHDKVALKEYEGRRINCENALRSAIHEGFDTALWFSNGVLFKDNSLSQIASHVADRIFPQTPKIKNELVNRNKLSGTAVSALKKLLEAMLSRENEPNLGITGFPPEMSMYSSCLKSTGIHSEQAVDGCHWFRDGGVSNELNILFSDALKLVKINNGTKILLSEVIELWSKPPYGLTYGVTLIFLLAFLKSLGQDIAYYEKDLNNDYVFITAPDIDYVHKLIKSPNELAIKYITLAKDEQSWLQHLASFAATEATTRDIANNILAVATPLVTLMHNLPHWVKNAHGLVEHDTAKNKLVLSVRDLFLQANDPHSLLMKDLTNIIDPSGTLSFTKRIDVLSECFKILREKHESMLNDIKSKVKAIFPENGSELELLCNVVEKNSGDLRLKAFARELAKSDTGLSQWLESMIQIVIGRGKQNWNEGLLLTAANKISDFAQDFLSVAKSQPSGSNISSTGSKTKLVSLVLEGDDGKLQSYKKEIRGVDDQKLLSTRNAIQAQLSKLDEFEKIHVLQNILKETLEAQG
jgi:energy-coupling factor transporter ATP-binding protein EcfA2